MNQSGYDPSNQRNSLRVPYASRLLVVHDRVAWRADLQDLSEGGCAVSRPEDCTLEIDALVRLFFVDSPGRTVGIDARVARDDSRSLGFEYHEPQIFPDAPDALD